MCSLCTHAKLRTGYNEIFAKVRFQITAVRHLTRHYALNIFLFDTVNAYDYYYYYYINMEGTKKER